MAKKKMKAFCRKHNQFHNPASKLYKKCKKAGDLAEAQQIVYGERADAKRLWKLAKAGKQLNIDELKLVSKYYRIEKW